MKKTIALVLVVSIVMLLIFTACTSIKAGDLIGVWTGAWTFNGNNINSSIEFKRDGTFKMETFINNKPSKSETGTYTIDGNIVNICYDKYKSTASYKYSNGKLTASSGPANYSKES